MRTNGLRQHTCKHNNHGIEDYLENADYEYPPGMSWVPFTDPDLVPVVLDRRFANLTGMDGDEKGVRNEWHFRLWRKDLRQRRQAAGTARNKDEWLASWDGRGNE